MYIIPIYLLYYWILSKFFNHFFHKKRLSSLKRWGFIATHVLLQLLFLRQLKNELMILLFNFILILGFCVFLYQAPFRRLFLLCVIVCTTGMIIEIAVFLVLISFVTSVPAITIAGNLISKMLLLTIIHILALVKTNTHNANISKRCFFLLIGASSSCIFIAYSIYVFYLENATLLVRRLSVSIIVSLILLNMFYYSIEDRLSSASLLMSQNLLLSKELKYYDSLINAQKSLNYSFSKERHNLKNQLLAIRSYAIQNNNAEIIEFVNSLLFKSEHGIMPTTVLFCQNLLLNTLFNAKVFLAKQYDIKYVLDIDVPSNLPFDSIDLCNFIGNALDNCFDACIQDKNFTNKYVYISVKFCNNILFCSFTNSCYHNLKVPGKGQFITTKKKNWNHGYGITSIKYVVEEYDGILDMQKNEHEFTLKAILYPH